MPTVLTVLKSETLTISLNRPERANAFNFEMLFELKRALEQAAKDAQIRGVVLTGTGNAFCAGHDINEMLGVQRQKVSYRKHLQESYNPLIMQLRQLEKPIIASINGPVAGAGLGVALACDLRFATDTVLFTVGFSGIGLVPDSGISLLLPVLIGLGRATEFTFTNQPMTADQALDWGLVNRVVPQGDLHSETTRLLAELVKGPIGIFGLTKRLYNRSMLPDLEELLEYEAQLQEVASKGEEHINGVKRFLENR